MRYRIYGDRVKLFDAYLIPKSKYSRELGMIRNLHPTCRLWHRSEANIKREWAAHVLAYSLGINIAKTESVDLEYEQKWWMSLAYFIVGNIALIFIK